MDGRPKRIKKFAFTIVCVYNRLRVDGALVYFELVYIESNSIRKTCLKEPYTPIELFPVKHFQGY